MVSYIFSCEDQVHQFLVVWHTSIWSLDSIPQGGPGFCIIVYKCKFQRAKVLCEMASALTIPSEVRKVNVAFTMLDYTNFNMPRNAL